MAGQHRNRTGEEKPACQHRQYVHSLNTHKNCKTTPNAGWNYCPYHHDHEATRLAAEWKTAIDNDQGTQTLIKLPAFNKPIAQLDREERAALGQLITQQLTDPEDA